ncbi:unnamed protein product, partial [Ilex paraguariensis]
MSRHRRQASLVLPPEIITGDDPPKASDFGQHGVVISGDTGKSGSTSSVTHHVQKTTTTTTTNQDASSPAPAKTQPT